MPGFGGNQMATDKRTFRHSVSILKKQGLIPSSIDARSALPDQKSRGKKLSTIVRRFDDIISGKATAVKLPPAVLKQHRKSGDETAYGKLIVPHSATQKATVHGGHVVIKSRSGIERVQLPIEFKNVKQYLKDIQKHEADINRLKGPKEYFAIRFHGGQRANAYSSISQLLADLSKYEAIQNSRSRAKQLEFYKGLEIVRMSSSAHAKFERELEASKPARQKAARKKARRRKGPNYLRKLRSKQAERAKAFRSTLTGAKLEKYKAAARKRALKAKKKSKKTRAKKNRKR